MASSERWAALDIGSDTVHLLVADVTRGPGTARSVRQVSQRSELLELGGEIARTGSFSGRTTRELVGVVTTFAAAARKANARLIAAATEASRDAKNGPAVLAQLSKAAGTEIRLVSGKREAELGFLGARAEVPATGTSLLIDSGGASTEVSVLTARRVVATASLPVGRRDSRHRCPAIRRGRCRGRWRRSGSRRHARPCRPDTRRGPSRRAARPTVWSASTRRARAIRTLSHSP
jgi:exopolyphosphatase/guanosine-5'-triphosphate,3'-diphosphate pyrophosphatase